MNTDTKREMNGRPRPGPLPQERKNLLPRLASSSRLDSREGKSNFNVASKLFPLLGGEGERYHRFQNYEANSKVENTVNLTKAIL